MIEELANDAWDHLEVGMKIETNINGRGYDGSVYHGIIVSITPLSLVLGRDNYGNWNVSRESLGFIRYEPRIRIDSSKYILSDSKGNILAYATDKDHLQELIVKFGGSVEIYGLKKVKTKISIEGL